MSASGPGTVIVGASVSGVRCAQALRAEGYDGRIMLVDVDRAAPYDKPDLTKAFLVDGADPKRLLAEGEACRLGVDAVFGRAAVGLSRDDAAVLLEGGVRIPFENLVIATGARARTLSSFEGYCNVHAVRTLDDALALRESLASARSLVVIGGGFIGGEVASSARKDGVEVTIVETESRLMTRSMPPAVADRIAEEYRRQGVTVVFGAMVTGPAQAEGDRVTAVALHDGATLPADAVVVGIGSIPNTEWLESSGLALDNGVLCGPDLRVPGEDRIFAIGDVARWSDGAGASRRAEHWTGAREQASLCARNIARGESETYWTDGYVWSDQFGMRVQYVGSGSPSEGIVTPSTPESGGEMYVQTVDGALVAAVGINAQRAILDVRKQLKLARV